MITATFAQFWTLPPREKSTPEPPKKRPGPLFIGDAVQPWGHETMLLTLLRRDAAKDDQSVR